MSIHGDHVQFPADRMEGHSVDDILRQAAAWRQYVEDNAAVNVTYAYSAATGEPVKADKPANERARCLHTALKYTQNDRNQVHGSPENNFDNIAAFWNAHLSARYPEHIHSSHEGTLELDATDVAIMMAGMKMARLSYNPAHEDSWIDLAGYAACGMEIALNKVDKT